MHWLLELLVDLFFPWGSYHEYRSIVGKSPIDRQAVWVARGLFILLIIAGVAWGIPREGLLGNESLRTVKGVAEVRNEPMGSAADEDVGVPGCVAPQLS
jgi:hypothetical protein